MDTRLLFQPGKIGKIEIKNRLVLSPVTTNLASLNGEVTQELLEFYIQRARGGVGLIILEGTRTETKIQPATITGINLRLDSHSYIAGLSHLTDAVHEYGAKIFIQLSLGQGSYAPPEIYEGTLPNAVSETASPVWGNRATHVITAEEIEKLIEAFASAAMRSKLAGFDGININGHGMYLISQFMSPFTNKRTDKYGDPSAVPLALIKAVKDQAGGDYPIMFRWNLDEFLPGGRTLDLSKENGRQFEKAGIHAIHVSGGNFWVPGGAVHSLPPMSFPQGYLRPLSRGMKDAVKIPVILASKIKDPSLANKILADGDADFIGMSRVLICEPEWPNKVAEGRYEDILPCISDNEGCQNRMASFRKIRCTVNYITGRERETQIAPARKSKKVLVAGGGPGGMEAARVAALRGHQVTLFEKSNRLGGRMILAGLIPHKSDINDLTDYLKTQIAKLGVKVVLGQQVTPELVDSLKPEAIILSTGSLALVPEIPGVRKGNVFFADDIVNESTEAIGEKIVVIGGGFVGLDTGLFLAEKKSKKVTIVEQFAFEALGVDPYNTNYMDIFQRLDKLGVELLPETKIQNIADLGAEVVDKQGKRSFVPANSFVLAAGGLPNKTLAETLKGQNPSIISVGDCVQVGKIIAAISGGFRAAFDL